MTGLAERRMASSDNTADEHRERPTAQLALVRGNFGRLALYPQLQTAEELGMTLPEHGEYIVQANASIHPETD